MVFAGEVEGGELHAFPTANENQHCIFFVIFIIFADPPTFCWFLSAIHGSCNHDFGHKLQNLLPSKKTTNAASKSLTKHFDGGIYWSD